LWCCCWRRRSFCASFHGALVSPAAMASAGGSCFSQRLPLDVGRCCSAHVAVQAAISSPLGSALTTPAGVVDAAAVRTTYCALNERRRACGRRKLERTNWRAAARRRRAACFTGKPHGLPRITACRQPAAAACTPSLHPGFFISDAQHISLTQTVGVVWRMQHGLFRRHIFWRCLPALRCAAAPLCCKGAAVTRLRLSRTRRTYLLAVLVLFLRGSYGSSWFAAGLRLRRPGLLAGGSRCALRSFSLLPLERRFFLLVLHCVKTPRLRTRIGHPHRA